MTVETPGYWELASPLDVDGDGVEDLVSAGGDRVWVSWGATEDVLLACP